MASIHLKNIQKVFSNNMIIDDLNLDVAEGEFVSILGPSGCGKTTCLRLISGLEDLSQGDICFGDSSVITTAPEQRGVGMVFQHYALFPHMTVEQNIIFGLKIRGESSQDIQPKLTEMLDIVQLTKEGKKYPSELSGGQMQRVALARTLITHPKVLLMDEPFANLDANLRNDMRDFVSSLQRKLKITTILVTHDQQEAMELSDRVAVMFEGKIAQYDTPDNLFNKPMNTNIASFLGAVNLLPGRLKSNGVFESEFGPLTVGSQFGVGHDIASVRPENVKLFEQNELAHNENCFQATIEQVKFSGVFSEITLSVGSRTITCMEMSRKARSAGQIIMVQFPIEDLWLMQGTQ